MARENRFVILLNDKERQAIEALAKVEKLPTSTFARRRLLLDADHMGIATHLGNENSSDQLSTAGAAVQP